MKSAGSILSINPHFSAHKMSVVQAFHFMWMRVSAGMDCVWFSVLTKDNLHKPLNRSNALITLSHTCFVKHLVKILLTLLAYTVLLGFILFPALLSAAAHAANVQPATFTMVVNMAPATCTLDPSRTKLRQCQEGFSLTISRLTPELATKMDPVKCQAPSADLPPLQKRVVERVMPDEQLRQQEWQRVGGCTGMTPVIYYRTIAKFAGKLRVPPELNPEKSIVVQRDALSSQLIRLNPGLTESAMQLRCTSSSRFQLPLLTEIRVCYTPQGDFAACPESPKFNCPASMIVFQNPD